MGISRLLLIQMAIKPDRHYRSFEILKKNGEPRVIEAPRVFLKTVQRFIADYVLGRLSVHTSVHSFLPGRSPVSNAYAHAHAKWVGTIDVKDFFPSIGIDAIHRLLRSSGYNENSARTISRLCTLGNVLPQGAPSSPLLSNAYLFQTDSMLSEMASALGLAYTRYADDLTFSGDNRSKVEEALTIAEVVLRNGSGLQINADKSRIMGPSSRRVVTGATVGRAVLPGRKLRRGIRAASYNLSRAPLVEVTELRRLEGYLSFFEAFPDFRDNKERWVIRNNLTKARDNISQS
jgi:retron-type reverse transcriptase